MSLPTLAVPAHVETLIDFDITENETAYTVRAALPGVRRQDIEIAVRSNEILLRAEVCCAERGCGTASRSFPLPAHADARGADVAFSDGVFILTLPKRASIDTSGNKLVLELQPSPLHMGGAGAYPAFSQP